MKKHATTSLLSAIILAIVIIPLVYSLPSAPSITYISNSTAADVSTNRSTDAKGTITTLTLSANQQNYKWKAYVGNVTGTLALDDANGYSIYNWNLGNSSGGEVYVSRYSSINFNSISCANQTAVNNDQTVTGMSSASADSINTTFNATTHRSFNVSTTTMSGCRSTATYVNDAPQTMGPSALFQEILLMDNDTKMVYTTLIENDEAGYNNLDYDFQLIVAENESATVPTVYYFWVELG